MSSSDTPSLVIIFYLISFAIFFGNIHFKKILITCNIKAWLIWIIWNICKIIVVILIAKVRPIRMLQIACKNFVGLDRPHCKRTKAAPASRFWAIQQMGIKWISGENRDNCFHLVDIEWFIFGEFLSSLHCKPQGRQTCVLGNGGR